jgi:hypothetical protein
MRQGGLSGVGGDGGDCIHWLEGNWVGVKWLDCGYLNWIEEEFRFAGQAFLKKRLQEIGHSDLKWLTSVAATMIQEENRYN